MFIQYKYFVCLVHKDESMLPIISYTYSYAILREHLHVTNDLLIADVILGSLAQTVMSHDAKGFSGKKRREKFLDGFNLAIPIG